MTGHKDKSGEDRRLQVSTDDSSDVDIGPPLPEGGGDSDVYKALRRDGKLVALKEVEITKSPSVIELSLQLVKELQILKDTQHENIVRYRDWTVFTEGVDEQKVVKLHLYSDFLRHDTLETRYKEFDLSERQIGLYTRHILTGIEYLHGKNILHRDIRCGNIWVDDEAVCKLANFGRAKELRHLKETLRSVGGREHWMAPEFASFKPYGREVDIWSLGCTVLEMLTKQKPFDTDEKELDAFEVLKLLKKGIGPTIPEYRCFSRGGESKTVKISRIARDFVELCLSVRPESRPTATKLLQHAFVNPKFNQPGADPDEEESDLASVGCEEPQNEAVELQCQDACQRHEVKQMCFRISKELEKIASDLSVIIISDDWLIKWQSDDDKVYAQLLDSGYMKTLETDTYSCFENILGTSDGGCSCCEDVQLLPDVSQQHSVSHGTAQGSGQHKDASLLPHDESSISGTEMQDGVHVDDQGSLEEAGPSGEENLLTATEVHDSKVPSMCSGGCPHIPLSVVKEKKCCDTGAPSPEALTVLKLWEPKDKTWFKVPLALSCCVNEGRLCIKISCFKGEICPSAATGTMRLRQTRLSISAKVDDKILILRPVDPDTHMERVCSKGKAPWEYKHGKQVSKSTWVNFKPSIQVPLVGGVALGEIGMQKRDDKGPSPVCSRTETLDLVVLKVGDTGCHWLDFKKVLVLQRNIGYTYLALGDVTCMDSQADSWPVVLTGNLHLDSSSSDDRHRERLVEITCCAELEIDFIPLEMKLRDIIQKEVMNIVDKKRKWVRLCHDGTDHVTFQGKVTTNL